jgi:hypothetical protein
VSRWSTRWLNDLDTYTWACFILGGEATGYPRPLCRQLWPSRSGGPPEGWAVDLSVVVLFCADADWPCVRARGSAVVLRSSGYASVLVAPVWWRLPPVNPRYEVW